MLHVGRYVFKCADAKHEFEQIHRLNYRTFVSEIPQHADNGTGSLIDKFHDKNVYVIVLKDERVVGMVGVHDQPPFSIEERLGDPEILSRPGTRPLEVRLLAVDRQVRNSAVFFGLINTLYEHCIRHDYTHVFISAVEQRVDLYERLGFVSLGPAVAAGKASFVPMMLTVGQLPVQMERVKERWEARMRCSQAPPTSDDEVDQCQDAEVCLLPGPVAIAKPVKNAFHAPITYHRGPEFIRRFLGVRRQLSKVVRGRDVAILNGSGTLANEAIAATLAALQRGGACPGRGLLLSNGEFGQRLARQAARFGMEPQLLSWPWGQPWDLGEVEAELANEPENSFVWGVHHESSTGVLNDLPGLVALCRRRGVRVCIDCVSSLGAVPLDLGHVFLASGATGKSLGSYAGAALVFADADTLRTLDRSCIPSYFDIVAALASKGPCYTFPSPTLFALEAALQEYATPQRAAATYQRYAELGGFVRRQLRELDVAPVAEEDCACPVVTTFTPPRAENSRAFVKRCQGWGFAIGGQSAYLAERNLVQIATMGAVTREMIRPLFDRIGQWLTANHATSVASC